MKNLFAAASYSFNNFYDNLNVQGQMVFSLIIFLIIVLCVLLFITYVVQDIKNKIRIHIIKKETKTINKEEIKKETITPITNNEVNVKNDVEDIAQAISNALEEEDPVSLTSFEDDQEKTAIISIDELVKKAKELEIVDDDNGDVNFLEKYNLEPAEVNIQTECVKNDTQEVKAFKVSQVISPIYGVKKEVINSQK